MRFACALVVYVVASSFVFAQEFRADLFGGYSYLNADTNGLTSRQNANGWEASVSGNFNRWFAAEGDVSGYYKTYDISGVGVGVQDYFYGGGPRINFKPVFVHALVGGDHLSAGAFGISAAQDSFAGAFGGGVQWRVSGPFSIRASADYVFSRHKIPEGPSATQNNVRASVGIVYSFGARTHATAPESEPRPTAAGMKVSVLGITVKLGPNPGAEIIDEAPNGVAALAGLHSGDVIIAVDGKTIRTPMELIAELSNRNRGEKMRLGYLIHGAWQTETVVVLP